MPCGGRPLAACVYPPPGDLAVQPVRLLTVAFFAFILPLDAPAEPARVRRDGAQVREATGFTGAVLASPARDEVVEVLEVSNEWRRVRTRSGREGWVHELFLEEAEQPARPASPPARAAPRPGALPKTESFEAPRVEETVETAPAVELERLRREVAAERAARAETERALAAAGGREADLGRRLAGAQADLRRLEGEVSEGLLAQRTTQRRRGDAESELRREGERRLDAAEQSRVRDLAGLAAAHDEEIAALEDSHESEMREAAESHAQALGDARSANSAEIAALQLRLQDEQDRIGTSFVEKCSALHDREMGRKAAEWAAGCDLRAQELQAAHAKELQKVSKQSGWEAEFESEVRARVRTEVAEQLGEAKLRWEARHRGDAVELDKEIAKLTARLEAEYEGRVLVAVSAESDRHRTELREQLRAARLEAERRCKLALELVLERTAAESPLGPGAEGRP